MMPSNQIYFSRYFYPSKADRCIYPGNNAFPIFINVLTKKADLTESFNSQKSSLPSSWNLRREKFKKTIESRQYQKFFIPLKWKEILTLN